MRINDQGKLLTITILNNFTAKEIMTDFNKRLSDTISLLCNLKELLGI